MSRRRRWIQQNKSKIKIGELIIKKIMDTDRDLDDINEDEVLGNTSDGLSFPSVPPSFPAHHLPFTGDAELVLTL